MCKENLCKSCEEYKFANEAANFNEFMARVLGTLSTENLQSIDNEKLITLLIRKQNNV